MAIVNTGQADLTEFNTERLLLTHIFSNFANEKRRPRGR